MRPRPARNVPLSLICLAVFAAGPRRCAPQPAPERAVVHGTVLHARTGKALARAGALLLLPDANGKQTGHTLPVPHMSGVPVDARGRFAIEGVPEGKYFLVISRSGYHSFSKLIPVNAPEVDVGRVSLAPYDSLSWRILAPDGKPLAKKAVYAAFRQGGSSPRNAKWVTDANGQYRTTFSSATRCSAFVRLPNVGSGSGEVLTKVGANAVGEIRLQIGGRVAGRFVSAATGKPLAGRTVTCVPHGKPPKAVGLAPYPVVGVKADKEGAFIIGGVYPGVWSLAPSGSDLLSQKWPVAQVVAGKTLDVGVVKVALAPRLTGRVLGLGGVPLATVRVATLFMELDAGGKPPKLWPLSVSLAADGRFATHARQVGRLRFAVAVPGEGCAVTEWLTATSETPLQIELPLEPFAALSGRVRDTEGRSVQGAQVALTPVPGSAAMALRSLRRATDNQGRFLVPELLPGKYTVSVSAPGLGVPAMPVVAAPASEPLLIELQPMPDAP